MGRPDARLESYSCQYERFPEETFWSSGGASYNEIFDGDNSLSDLIYRVETQMCI